MKLAASVNNINEILLGLNSYAIPLVISDTQLESSDFFKLFIFSVLKQLNKISFQLKFLKFNHLYNLSYPSNFCLKLCLTVYVGLKHEY